MKKLLITLILSSIAIPVFSQEKDTEKIEKEILYEAKELYQSEWASWYGTDVFSAKYKNTIKVGGYLSYDDGKGMVNIFFSADSIPKAVITISFGYDWDPNKYTVDTTKRGFNSQEKDLYTIRKAALKAMNTDTIFKYYKNANLNAVPLINKNNKWVYVLTGTTANDVILLGNDYKIDFNKSNEMTGITKLHNSLIAINYTNNTADSSKTQKASIHSHVKGKDEFITATDICTLRLYGKFTTWQTHYVISPTYVSIWDIKQEKLVILTRAAWDRINEDQKKRHPEKFQN